jgi:ketosteroid isomerase-like protein
MFRCLLRLLPVMTLLLLVPAPASAQEPTPDAAKADAEVREAVRRYDAALRRADVAAVDSFWAAEYTFVNPRGEVLTRAARAANLRAGRTAFDSLSHASEEEQIRTYGNGDVAVHTALLTLSARYSGQAQRGRYRAVVVWVRRDGRWQQVASQLTQVLVP